MTESSYQQAKTIMHKANAWRTKIKLAEREIERYKGIAALNKEAGRFARYEAAKVNIIHFEGQLQRAIAEFSVLKLPN